MSHLSPSQLSAQFPTFTRSLDDGELAALSSALAPRELARGEALLVEGQPSSSLYLVTRGQCTVRVAAANEPMLVATVGPGAIVGEVSFIDGGKTSATLRALEPTFVLALHREAFDALASSHPAVATRVLGNVCASLAARIRTATDRFDTLAPSEAIVEDAPGILDRLYDLFGLSRS